MENDNMTRVHTTPQMSKLYTNTCALHLLQVAETLYIQGYVSYPRTESSAYPPNFDFNEILTALCSQPVWGACARVLFSHYFLEPAILSGLVCPAD